MNWQERTELLLGKESLNRLQKSHVLILGLGGVGAYAAEQLARAGIGKLSIVDGDSIHPSNRNRQLLALKSTEGKAKAQLLKGRLLDINPKLEVEAIQEYVHEVRINQILTKKYDYVIDAIDTLTPKLLLIQAALRTKNPLISSMGSGGKMDPLKIQISDISETYNDKLARILRKRLRKFGIQNGFKAVFSHELIKPDSFEPVENELNKKTRVGTISYMPALFGIHLAAEVIRCLISEEE